MNLVIVANCFCGPRKNLLQDPRYEHYDAVSSLENFYQKILPIGRLKQQLTQNNPNNIFKENWF